MRIAIWFFIPLGASYREQHTPTLSILYCHWPSWLAYLRAANSSDIIYFCCLFWVRLCLSVVHGSGTLLFRLSLWLLFSLCPVFVPPCSVVWARRLPLLLLLPNKYRRVQLLGKRLRRNQARLFLFIPQPMIIMGPVRYQIVASSSSSALYISPDGENTSLIHALMARVSLLQSFGNYNW